MPLSVHDVAAALRDRIPGLPTVKLHKLLYYCQGHHLAWFDQPLFVEPLSAWDMGPVVSALWRAENKSTPPPPRHDMGEAELNTIGYVVSRYGNLTGKDLENLTHSEDPWREANEDRPPGGDAPIDLDTLSRYFKADHADGSLDSPVLREWLRATANLARGPARPDSLEALRAKRDAVAAGLAPDG